MSKKENPLIPREALDAIEEALKAPNFETLQKAAIAVQSAAANNNRAVLEMCENINRLTGQKTEKPAPKKRKRRTP